MIKTVQALLRGAFDVAERGLDRLFGSQANPLAQLGALGYFLFWIVAASGFYVFALFDTGVTLITDKPVDGVESIDATKGAELCWG